ncbi:Multiple organellar RNA editing factor 3 [Ranunculus cassubicifolius]
MALQTRRALSTIISRTISSSSTLPHYSRLALAIQFQQSPQLDSRKIPTRPKTSGSGYSPLNDPSPNWSNRPPKETILLDGCDYEHWLIVLEFPNDPKPSPDEMINSYVKTLAAVLGSEEEARKKIYSVSTTTYTGFGCLISEEISNKLKSIPGVLWVLPDSYLDVPKKDYGGDLFVDGKVTRRPQFDYTDRQYQGRRPRPRYDRRRETMQVERREPMQRGNFAPEQRMPASQPTAMAGQNSFNGPPQVEYGRGSSQNSFNNHNQVDYNRDTD